MILRINPHQTKENIHLKSTSISPTLFRSFSFSGTSVSLSKSRDTGADPKKKVHFVVAVVFEAEETKTEDDGAHILVRHSHSVLKVLDKLVTAR
jgi:hypothetical protein